MIRGFCWTRSFFPDHKAPNQSEFSNVVHHNIPSWSWASIKGKNVRFHIPEELELGRLRGYWIEEEATVIDCQTNPSTSDPFGVISGGHIVLRAPFLAINDPRENDLDFRRSERFQAIHEQIQKCMQTKSALDEFSQQHKDHAGQEFALIRLLETSCQGSFLDSSGRPLRKHAFDLLILESTGEGENEYRRIGKFVVVTFDFTGEVWLKEMNDAEWKWKKVRLV